MGSRKKAGEKVKRIASKMQSAPRWVDIRKFGMKRARARRVRVPGQRGWMRRGRLKV